MQISRALVAFSLAKGQTGGGPADCNALHKSGTTLYQLLSLAWPTPCSLPGQVTRPCYTLALPAQQPQHLLDLDLMTLMGWQAGTEKQALQSMLQSLQDQASRAASEASRAADQAKQQRVDAAKALSAANAELDNDRRQIDSLRV